jgi:ketosteroid isomerase-like protein
VTGAAGFFDGLAKNVRYAAITPRFHMIQEDSKGILLFIFVLEEGTVVPTGRSFSFEAVHAWRFDLDGRIQDFEYYHHSFDLVAAFSNLVLEPSIVYRHPLPHEVITPTRPTPADPGAVVERFYETLNAVDVPALLDLFADDAVSTLEGVENVVPFSGTYRGKAGLLRQVQAVGPCLIPLEEELELRYIVDGNRLCVRFMDTSIVRQGNVPLSFLNIHFFTVNEQGKIVVFRSYNDTWHVANGFGFVPKWS